MCERAICLICAVIIIDKGRRCNMVKVEKKCSSIASKCFASFLFLAYQLQLHQCAKKCSLANTSSTWQLWMLSFISMFSSVLGFGWEKGAVTLQVQAYYLQLQLYPIFSPFRRSYYNGFLKRYLVWKITTDVLSLLFN